jgi:hypothetical protein
MDTSSIHADAVGSVWADWDPQGQGGICMDGMGSMWLLGFFFITF